MNETLGRGYARIEAIRAARGEPLASVPDSNASPPDKYNSVYLTLFVAGVAFLLPFNSFIMAVDYFQLHYPETTIMFDMSTVYIASACVAVVANNLLLDLFTYNTRITFGILISLATMLFVAVCNIGWDGFSTRVSYTINLVAIGIVAFGCTVQQASYYGFTGCLPPRYTQAVMAGESAAGFWVSLDRIVTKYGFRQPQRSTFMFFVFSILILLGHSMLHHVMMRHPLVQHYLRLTRESRHRRRIHLHLNPNEDATLVETEGPDNNYGVLKLQSPPPSITDRGEGGSNAFSFANPLYSPTAPAPAPTPLVSPPAVSPSETLRTPRPSYKVEDVVFETPERLTSWRAFKHGVAARWAVARAIYPYMVSIGLVYFTTLSLYPGIASEVPSCRLGSWMPIVLMSAFNLFDLIGKVAAAWPYEWSRSQLLMASGLRLLLVPLVLLCAAPRFSPHIVGDVSAISNLTQWLKSLFALRAASKEQYRLNLNVTVPCCYHLLQTPSPLSHSLLHRISQFLPKRPATRRRTLWSCECPQAAPNTYLLCNGSHVYPIFFSVVLGFTNGLFGSVPMIMAPSRVSREHREIAGDNALHCNKSIFRVPLSSECSRKAD
ncbi:Equilibrative nucleoside transporter 4 [Eumeta japonica]|uniref:Equilibrative nucleoside transporter 4 n=1 Tax=Eumeta variegata TaxID=151549 RepID=A0A4C2A458_EUMVA|nr:Equilibrative nucleoside transporter 4 [Eumeta japonica]